ncbi:hypothetical protein [Maricaulis sp.]|uniref:hypothetical protein n=1 Tax=Maricaulis sp. TaxID=1486257 RepID=UPI003A8D385C
MSDCVVSSAGRPLAGRSYGRSRLAQAFLVSASAGVLASLLPAMALGQAVPAGCTPTPATAGDTIDCVTASPATIDGITTTVDDLTINIGSPVTPTTVLNIAGAGVSMTGADGLTLNLTAAGSSITGTTDGVFMQQTGGGSDLTIAAHGDIAGNQYGIRASNGGTGRLNIAAADVTGMTADGIYARTAATTTGLTISASGTVAGADNAIDVHHAGNGDVTLNLGTVTGTTGDAIRVSDTGIGDDISIYASGLITGGEDGIEVDHYGIGSVTIDTAAITAAGDGINVFSGVNGTDVDISAGGTVTAGNTGILAGNYGIGALNITTTSAVTGLAGDGIRAFNSAVDGDLIITAHGAVSGADYGIRAVGSGRVTVTAGTVSGAAIEGIHAQNNAGSTTDLTVSATGTVSGGETGIWASNLGSAALIITAADVTGTGNYGISANNGSGTDLTITANGAVSGGVDGVRAINSGTGALSITTDGAVTGTGFSGIFASNGATATDLDITASGPVTGSFAGIRATNDGTGALNITAADVTGTTDYGIYARTAATSTGVSIAASGTVSGAGNGIDVEHLGTGVLAINAAAVTAGGDGIRAVNAAAGGGLTITASGAVSGGSSGIYTRNYGTGALSVTTAAVTGAGASGIYAFNAATGTGLSVAATGLVSGANYGIETGNLGTGPLTITADAVTGTAGAGIVALSVGTDLTITASGPTTGGTTGIAASNTGTGSLNISSAAVTGQARYGIEARNGAGADELTITATGPVEGGLSGIFAMNLGRGALSITAGATNGTTHYGIYAANFGTDLRITATGAITGGEVGIGARNSGTGALSITAVDVAGTDTAGIYAYSGTAGTDLTVSATGTVTGRRFGIRAQGAGSGALSITAADVTATEADGISAVSGANGTGMTILASGLVSGGEDGVDAHHTGTGDLTLDLGAVTGATGDGVYARNALIGTGITITASGAISGGDNGIFARNSGTGALRLATGAVTGTTTMGIWAINDDVGTDLTLVATGAISGGSDGIRARSEGSGELNLSATAVTGADGDGIYATNLAGTDLTITASGTVTGGDFGVYATNFGSGALSINAAAISGGEDGVFAYNSSAGTDLSITTSGAITAGDDGVSARNDGSGALSITTAAVTGADGQGILALNSLAGTDLTITATGPVSGSDAGIYARNYGTGALGITSAAVTGAGTDGISAVNSAAGTDLSVTATGLVTGAAGGLDAFNYGSGALTINVAAVTGGTHGIHASNSAAGTDLTVTASGEITGSAFGVYAANLGSGALSITAAAITGGQQGVVATNSSAGTDLSIATSGTVTGGINGVLAWNDGSGALSATTAAVTGTAVDGIVAGNTAAGTDLSVTATGLVSGADDGIEAFNSGSGALTINAAAVSGGEFGIFASNSAAGTDLTIVATGEITSGWTGVQGVNHGLGGLVITTETVTGSDWNGISAFNGTGGSDLTLTANGTVSGGVNGIAVLNDGRGDLVINAADVNAGSGTGVLAQTGTGAADLSITAGNLTSTSGAGIAVSHLGSGDASITLASVTALAGSAVTAYAGTGSGALSVNVAGDVAGQDAGIVAANLSPTGSLSINAAAVTADNGVAISAYNAGSGGLSITTTGDVTGSTIGVRAENLAGELAIDAGGDITGGSYGIWTETVEGTDLVIRAGQIVTGGVWGILTGTDTSASTSNDTLNILGTVNGHIGTGHGADVVTLAAGSAVNGAILLGDGEDVLNYDGGSFGVARGGDGTDRLNFSGPGVWITNSGDPAADVFADFELYHFFGGGYVLDGLHQGLIETHFHAGENYLMGTLASRDVMIDAGAGLETGADASLIGNLTNAGSLGINAGGVGRFGIDGDFTQAATGDLTLDLSASGQWNDRLAVSGDVTLAGELVLRQYGAFGAPVTLIDASTGLAGSFDSVTGLLDQSLLASQVLEYDRAGFDVNLVTVFADAGTIDGLTPNQISIADALIDQLAALPDNDDFSDFGYAVAGISDGPLLAETLEQLNPEIIDAGIQVARTSQFLFLTGLMDRNGAPARGPQPVQVASLDNALPDWSSSEDKAHVWGSLQLAGYEQGNGGVNIEYSTNGLELAFGTADLRAGAFSFGFAVGYADLESALSGADDDHVSTEMFRYGLFGRYDLNAGATGLQAHLDGSLALGRGQQDTRMEIVAPAAGLGQTQTGSTHFNTLAGALRLTLDGYNDHGWAVRPHLVIAADRYDQSAHQIGTDGVAAIAMPGIELDRVSYGYGASFEHQWGGGNSFAVSATGVRHTGDAVAAFSPSFAASGLNGPDSFAIAGRGIEEEYVLGARFRSETENGYSATIGGFAQFGDLEGVGAEIRITKRF